MKKLFFVLAVLMIGVTTVKAQNTMSSVKFSIGVEPSLPIGDFSDAGYNFGIGGSLQGEYKPASDLGLTLNAGYINYSAEGNGGNYGLIPVLAGVKYYFTPKVYGHGQLGAGFGTQSGSGTSFVYSPGIGAYISDKVDLLVKFVGNSQNGINLNSIGARLAYNFGR
jgi:hypothetical protein